LGRTISIIWKNGIAYPLDEKELPLELPHVESYQPGPEGEGPLANLPEWISILLPLREVGEGLWKRIPCPATQAHRGTFFDIWTLTMKKNFATEKFRLLGTG
jgi:hypothetical protein